MRQKFAVPAEGFSFISLALVMTFLAAYFLQVNPQPPTMNGLVLAPLCCWAFIVAIYNHIAPNAGLSRQLTMEVAISGILALSFAVSAVANINRYDFLELRPYILGFGALGCTWILARNGNVLGVFFDIYTAIAGILSILQVYVSRDFYPTLLYGVPPASIYASGFSAFSNYGAIFLAYTLTHTLFRWTCGGELFGRASMLRLLSICLGSAGMALTFSRAGFVALAFGLLLLALKSWKTPRRNRAIFACAVVSAALLSALVPVPTQHRAYLAQKFEVETVQGVSTTQELPWWTKFGSPSLNSRAFALQSAISAFTSDGVLGVGVGNFEEYYQSSYRALPETLLQFLDPRSALTPHNAYLGLLIETGPITLAAALGLIALLFVRGMFRPMDDVAFHAATALGVVAIWMLFHDGFQERIIWIALGLAGAFLTTPTRTVEHVGQTT